MHHFIATLILTFACTLATEKSFALVSVYGLVGKTVGSASNDDGSTKLDGYSLMAGVHFDPIPLVPVAAGLALRQSQFSSNSDLKDAQLLEVIPEVKAWLPLGDFVPYAKLGYILYGHAMGTFKGTSDTKFTADEKSPFYFAAGLEYHLLPLVALLLEYQHTTAQWKYSQYETGGVSNSSPSNSNTRLGTYAVGVSVGL